jgi:hypothetical protein
MNLIETYDSLPMRLKEQLSHLERHFKNDQNIREYYRHMVKTIKDDGGKIKTSDHDIIFRLAILTVASPMNIIHQNYFPLISCYHEKDENKIFTFRSLLKEGRHAKVLECTGGTKTRIMKWYKSNKRDTCFEIGIYDKLSSMEESKYLPWYSSSYFFWNNRVLIIEKLKPLSRHDDEYLLGIQIIEQLRPLHKFGIHCDIKPQNVMKKKSKTDVIYYLIDYGGVATEKLEHGYRRWLWSPHWTSQLKHEQNQVTTAKADFVELAFTMKAIQNMKKGDDKGMQVKKGFKGKLQTYMNYVSKIDDKNIPLDIHDKLIEILK